MDIQRRLKHTRQWFWIILSLMICILLTLVFFEPDYFKAEVKDQELEGEKASVVTRLPGGNEVETAVAISQTVYAATFADNKPGAVILVPVGDWRSAVLASEISHFPINAPVLYTEKDSIPELTMNEIKRLDPEGIFLDGNKKVLLIGDIGLGVKNELRKEKMKYRELSGQSIEELASILDDYKALIHVNHDDEVIIIPRDEPAYSILAASWVAHMGHSIFFVDQDGLSEFTRKSLSRRPQDAFIYVLADDKVIPHQITEELSKYGHVQRIPGKDPWEMSVGFAGYKDVGRNFGWWIDRTTRSFGWGIAEAGHNFTFINPKYPGYAVPAAILSHMGKHGPFLLVEESGVPVPVVNYLQTVQPSFLSSQEQLFNHGWVIGSQELIGSEVLRQLDTLLQVKNMGGEKQ